MNPYLGALLVVLALPIGHLVGKVIERCPSKWRDTYGEVQRCELRRWHSDDLHRAGRGLLACQWLDKEGR